MPRGHLKIVKSHDMYSLTLIKMAANHVVAYILMRSPAKVEKNHMVGIFKKIFFSNNLLISICTSLCRYMFFKWELNSSYMHISTQSWIQVINTYMQSCVRPSYRRGKSDSCYKKYVSALINTFEEDDLKIKAIYYIKH